jgi:hypothetical protein
MTADPADVNFSDPDRKQFDQLGLSEKEVRRQIRLFRSPPPPLRLVRPATLGDGIIQIAKGDRLRLEVAWAELSSSGRIVKFVPASGAASRMFRQLEAIHHGEAGGGNGGLPDRTALAERAAGGDEAASRALTFLDRLERFAFYEDLDRALAAAGEDLATLRREGHVGPILDHLLTEAGGHGLSYGELAKGLVRFHRYPGERRTAFEEHLVEAVGVVRDEEGVCRLHFTVQPQHREAFEACLEEVRARFEDRYECSFEVGFSHQSHATDTVAVDLDDRPFRLDDGSLLFRPGGHGALLGNLEALAADGAEVAVVKNIDNVVPEKHQELVLLWKRLLLGHLQELRDRAFDLLAALESTGGDDADLLAEGADLAAELGHPMPRKVAGGTPAARRAWLIERLDRPLRVCGVVKNEGEPGGGPFWVRGEDGAESLQIVEKSQIDLDDPAQAEIVADSTHFNPVDVVCSLTDRSGIPYDLANLVDESAVFIARKSHQGRPLKALERPGLWNGAMAGWNTVFVAVPLATFAPVKTVFDLLRDAHQTGVPPEE